MGNVRECGDVSIGECGTCCVPSEGISLPWEQVLAVSKDFGVDVTSDDFPPGTMTTTVDAILAGDFLVSILKGGTDICGKAWGCSLRGYN